MLQIHWEQNTTGMEERGQDSEDFSFSRENKAEPYLCCITAIWMVAQLLPLLTLPLRNLLLVFRLHGSALLLLLTEANGISIPFDFN